MPFKETEILKFNQCQESEKAPFIIQEDLESFIKKWIDVKINLNILLQQK